MGTNALAFAPAFKLARGRGKIVRLAHLGYVGTFDAPGIKILTSYAVPQAIATGYTLVLHIALWLPITLLGALLMLLDHVGWGDFGRAVEERGLEVSS